MELTFSVYSLADLKAVKLASFTTAQDALDYTKKKASSYGSALSLLIIKGEILEVIQGTHGKV